MIYEIIVAIGITLFGLVCAVLAFLTFVGLSRGNPSKTAEWWLIGFIVVAICSILTGVLILVL